MPRRFLTDAGLALALFLLTVIPWLVNGLMTGQKAKAPAELSAGWWMLAGLIIAGLLLRRQRPWLALALVGVGVFGHLITQTKFQLIDLALPLMMYTMADGARRRRTAIILLTALMSLTYSAMLISRVQVNQESLGAAKDAQAAKEGQVVERIIVGTSVPAQDTHWWVDPVVDTSQAALELWLLLVAAYAVGDGMRSRRAHLAAVEQRTADLAREERQRAALAVAAERARITRELHDVVAHGISVMVVQAQGAAAALDRHPDRAATALDHVIATGRSSLAEMRRLLAANRSERAAPSALTATRASPGAEAVTRASSGVESAAGAPSAVEAARGSPGAKAAWGSSGEDVAARASRGVDPAFPRAEAVELAPLPGIGAVPALVDQLRLAGMRIELHIDGVPEVVPAAVDLSAYRIVQEALTNILKHAGPDAAAEVRLRFDPDRLRVEVVDDGCGPAGAGADGHGNGLRGIAERVAMLGGALETGRGPGGGFRVGALLPVDP
ncbi:hypothetical protein GCM10010168_62430 [Actinoplanes ianthinogenes]|uniref:histidine kinase n=1 Tax=Actinoplanes ianthinogenes TaxID=122358 RepID=A0ABM7LJR9_9ACTN|nr:histidine kinase [Actinoplanes ianthinogenes]BCJ39509.1 hypothetical protein Aiant_01660 [Actinoplanes ianthinogenes]GGR35596.1 hypothetical protein GCM10010168_62430 [Actinoplanes ianthinogenes]